MFPYILLLVIKLLVSENAALKFLQPLRQFSAKKSNDFMQHISVLRLYLCIRLAMEQLFDLRECALSYFYIRL